jgi:Ca2+-binding EF-hand superfamily protein
MSHDDKLEFTAKVTADLKAKMSLNKAEMSTLLVEMGVSMKTHELRHVVDAFDADGDGVVTLNEFLSFTGPKRDKHSGL